MKQAYSLLLLLLNILEDSEKKRSQKNFKERIKQSLYSDDIIGNVENRKEYVFTFKFLCRQNFPKQGTKGMNQKGTTVKRKKKNDD